MNIEKVSQRIGQKDWFEVKNYWQNFIHILDFPIVEIYNFEFLDVKLKEVSDEIENVESTSTVRDHYFQIDGIQLRIFSDSIILFYKGINAIKSAQCDQLSGYKTWSLNNFYQSSYFLVKSLMNLLGISIIRTVNNVELLVDLLPEYKKISKRQLIRNREVFECQVQSIQQLEHWQIWRILQKLLGYLKNSPVREDYLCIFNFDSKAYPKHRNSIIYNNDIWFFNDLKKELIDDEFGILEIDGLEIDSLSDELHFTLVASYVLVYIEKVLFKDISKNNKHFSVEFNDIQSALLHENNKNYRKFEDINILL